MPSSAPANTPLCHASLPYASAVDTPNPTLMCCSALLALLGATTLVCTSAYSRTSGKGFSLDHIVTSFFKSCEKVVDTPNGNSAIYALTSIATFGSGAALLFNPAALVRSRPLLRCLGFRSTPHSWSGAGCRAV